jgi:hypothetical protein
MAVAGAAITTVGAVTGASTESGAVETRESSDRCPYFDQPMYCKGLTPDGRPMCEK